MSNSRLVLLPTRKVGFARRKGSIIEVFGRKLLFSRLFDFPPGLSFLQFFLLPLKSNNFVLNFSQPPFILLPLRGIRSFTLGLDFAMSGLSKF